VIAIPQMWWSTHNSAVSAGKFLEWHFGWDHGSADPFWFWFINTGLFIPLILIAIFWRGRHRLVSKRLLIFYLPFTLCFIIPNFVKLAPWIWDNVKVLFYWWVASAPLVALLISRLWQRRGMWRPVSALLFVCVTLAGALDVAAIILRSKKYQIFDRAGIEFSELVKQRTAPRALIAHAPVHNHPIFLTGRASLMGYPGHIWTHGLDYQQRRDEITRIFAGTPDAPLLIEKYGIQYAVLGPLERKELQVNERFLSLYPKVGEAGGYELYKIAP
jgi:hypothetical protein